MNASPVTVVAEFHGFSEPDAEPVPWSARLESVVSAGTFWLSGRKYGRQTWDYVVRDGAFTHRAVGGRSIVFRVRPVRGLGFRKGDAFSQTTWRFER